MTVFDLVAGIGAKTHTNGMQRPDGLQVGDRVQLSGGYSFEPEWLDGRECIRGSVIAFAPGQSETPAAIVRIDEAITCGGISGDILVLTLRYVDAVWGASGTVHVELCDFVPEPIPWVDRRKGKWAESHATYERLAA